MRACSSCDVEVYGSSPVCPLCQGALPGAPCPGEDIFPLPVADAEAAREKRFIAALATGSAGAVVVCIALNYLLAAGHRWSLFVLGGVASFWLCWFLTETRKRTIPRSVVWDILVFSLVSVLWDIFTGFHGWSVDYVVPILLGFGVTVLSVLSGTGVVTGNSITFYRFVLGLLGAVPVALLLAGVARLYLPSVICAVLCALSLIQVLGFEGQRLMPELKRRLHI